MSQVAGWVASRHAITLALAGAEVILPCRTKADKRGGSAHTAGMDLDMSARCVALSQVGWDKPRSKKNESSVFWGDYGGRIASRRL